MNAVSPRHDVIAKLAAVAAKAGRYPVLVEYNSNGYFADLGHGPVRLGRHAGYAARQLRRIIDGAV